LCSERENKITKERERVKSREQERGMRASSVSLLIPERENKITKERERVTQRVRKEDKSGAERELRESEGRGLSGVGGNAGARVMKRRFVTSSPC
jgi:hypothetical protein